MYIILKTLTSLCKALLGILDQSILVRIGLEGTVRFRSLGLLVAPDIDANSRAGKSSHVAKSSNATAYYYHHQNESGHFL